MLQLFSFISVKHTVLYTKCQIFNLKLKQTTNYIYRVSGFKTWPNFITD